MHISLKSQWKSLKAWASAFLHYYHHFASDVLVFLIWYRVLNNSLHTIKNYRVVIIKPITKTTSTIDIIGILLVLSSLFYTHSFHKISSAFWKMRSRFSQVIWLNTKSRAILALSHHVLVPMDRAWTDSSHLNSKCELIFSSHF